MTVLSPKMTNSASCLKKLKTLKFDIARLKKPDRQIH
tara:strand:+ start:76 stop:186 length:111 start_codon:yes stop_codon:yes gene_type:complete